MAANVSVVKTGGAPNILLRLLWFIFIGSWLGQIVLVLAWALNVTVIGMALGVPLLNALPGVLTLHNPRRVSVYVGGQAVVEQKPPPFLVRAVYFIFIGSWFSLLWMETAWVLCVIVVGLPLGFWMFGRAAKVTTLALA